MVRQRYMNNIISNIEDINAHDRNQYRNVTPFHNKVNGIDLHMKFYIEY